MDRRSFLLGLFSLGGCAVGNWSVHLPTGPMMKDGEAIDIPVYWQSFVSRYPDQASLGEAGLLPLDAVTHEELYRTNAFWNTRMDFRHEDIERFDCFSRDDMGRVPVRGDCEDFALSKRRELRAKFPQYAGCFRIAICEPVGGARRRLVGSGYRRNVDPLHAVLTVDTTGGTLILDMRRPGADRSLPYNVATEPEYHWHQRELNGERWVAIERSA